MDQLFLKTVAFVEGTSTFVCLLWSRLRLKEDEAAGIFEYEYNNGVVYDCVVCLCEMYPRHDESRRLPNCDHGIQFHARCIDAWLRDHSTCPVCRSHVPRPWSQRLHIYLHQHLLEDVISYCNSALDSVANSVGDCRDF
ncbi:hypothetical protein R6Q57_008483 [Mikania cordata]